MMDKSLLRELVKSVIAEEVAAIRKPAHATAGEARAVESVRIGGDADLLAFARKVLSLASDPAKAKEIAAGRYPFRLEGATAPVQVAAATPAPKPAAPTAPVAQSIRVERGVVTETMLNKLPRGTARLVLAPGVTVTPLAKDRARALGLVFERT